MSVHKASILITPVLDALHVRHGYGLAGRTHTHTHTCACTHTENWYKFTVENGCNGDLLYVPHDILLNTHTAACFG